MVELQEITVIQAPVDRCFDLARSIEVHLAENVHCGVPAVASGRITSGLVSMEQSVTWRARHFGVMQSLTTRITAFDRPCYFQDTMTHGIFRSMQHDHFFRALSPAETEMKDILIFAAPLPYFGRLTEVVMLRRYMRGLLRERSAVLKQIAESTEWRRYLPAGE